MNSYTTCSLLACMNSYTTCSLLARMNSYTTCSLLACMNSYTTCSRVQHSDRLRSVVCFVDKHLPVTAPVHWLSVPEAYNEQVCLKEGFGAVCTHHITGLGAKCTQHITGFGVECTLHFTCFGLHCAPLWPYNEQIIIRCNDNITLIITIA